MWQIYHNTKYSDLKYTNLVFYKSWFLKVKVLSFCLFIRFFAKMYQYGKTKRIFRPNQRPFKKIRSYLSWEGNLLLQNFIYLVNIYLLHRVSIQSYYFQVTSQNQWNNSLKLKIWVSVCLTKVIFKVIPVEAILY